MKLIDIFALWVAGLVLSAPAYLSILAILSRIGDRKEKEEQKPKPNVLQTAFWFTVAMALWPIGIPAGIVIAIIYNFL